MPVYIDSANNVNKLSLVEMQLPEEYQENFSLYFSGRCIPTNESLKKARAANYCRTSDNVRLNLANVRAKVILIGHWSDHKK